MTIGNHDIGYNAGAHRIVEKKENFAHPIYYSYFPQHLNSLG
jgi:hypothetical protein